jgi:hypothetical protein
MNIVKTKRCGLCKNDDAKLDTKFMVCSICKSVPYCSRECQKEDWKTHKKVCSEGETNSRLRRKFTEWYTSIKLSLPIFQPWTYAKPGQFLHIEISKIDEFLNSTNNMWQIYDVKGLYVLIEKLDDKDRTIFGVLMEQYEADKENTVPVFVNLHTRIDRSIFLLYMEKI